MKVLLRAVLGAALLLLPAVPGWALQGQFTAVGPEPAPHSLEVVVLEEFLNFTCPHCNAFREQAQPLLAKYGKRVKLVRMPVLFQGQTEGPLRLYFVAVRHHKGDEIADALFDAAFKYNVNIYDAQVVDYLARTNGLQEALAQEGNTDAVTQEIVNTRARADRYGVEATPTVVIQGALLVTPTGAMDAYLANLDQIIGELLKGKEKSRS